ncbi:4Fe-4S binding protein [Acidaminococcus sp. NSJ-142]|jgi:iron only hydrogenase large subunit-like protein|uniref:[Fe-Fe] hydrogenase large subunit C-terminal domain-containing protein n=1 Tax=Acidaminococcus TaxID=904 RepID=UPI001E31CD94|nr:MULTISPECIES: [Fe-Fe] hydrogenase large subunit C-terminal domain-containing protein [Acidaminococcus]MCD2435753.1 4Fe-4S binding protein [Acidaminococcus hominis]MCH4096468.1 4Fe-4S binding protein [Acidaminococcus provencensis]
MESYLCSVQVDREKCTGCLLCVKNCLVQAIRVRQGKAQIISDKCIDCGECIRCCPPRAIEGLADPLDRLKDYRVNLALATPSLYAQFPGDLPASILWEGLREIGFDGVFDVALAGDYVSGEMERYLAQYQGPWPVISSACPAVLRLIQTRYPELVKQVLPVLAPAEAAAIYTRRETTKRLGPDPEQVGIWFISPCPAKGTNIHQSVDVLHTAVTGSFTIASIYGPLSKAVKELREKRHEWPEATLGSSYGLSWGTWEGEVLSTGTTSYVAAQGPQEVDELLQQISLNKLSEVRYACCYSCAGGCVGGPCVAVNKFVGNAQLHRRVQRRREREPQDRLETLHRHQVCEDFPLSEGYIKALQPRPDPPLAEDFREALDKLSQLRQLQAELPQIDCGACGAPTCNTLAEDVVRGYAQKDDCIFVYRKEWGKDRKNQ